MKKARNMVIWLVLIPVFITSFSICVQAKSVLFIGKFGLDVWRNKVYSDLLTDGFSFEDFDIPGHRFTGFGKCRNGCELEGGL